MAHILCTWAQTAGPIGWAVWALCTSCKAWLGHVERRDVLAKVLEQTDSADKAEVIKAWAALERGTRRSDLPHQLRK